MKQKGFAPILIVLLFSAIFIVAAGAGYWHSSENKKEASSEVVKEETKGPPQPIVAENFATILGPGFPKAFDKVAEMCGKDIYLLQYRIRGFYRGKAYPSDTQLSQDTIVEYSFTQGECAPGRYAAIEVVFDIKQNLVTDGPREHIFGADTREPMDEADLKKIKISVDEAIKISGQQPFVLIKYGGVIIWDVSPPSYGIGLSHQIWIDAITGEKVRDRSYRPTL